MTRRMAQVGIGTMVERAFIIGSCLLASCASAPAAPTQAAPTPGSKGMHAPVTEAATLERLESNLKNSAMGTSLPRLVIGDVAYPRSPEELSQRSEGWPCSWSRRVPGTKLSCHSNG